MTTASDKKTRTVLVDLDELKRLKLALQRARDYHPVNRQLWIQFAGLIERLEKQPRAAESQQ